MHFVGSHSPAPLMLTCSLLPLSKKKGSNPSRKQNLRCSVAFLFFIFPYLGKKKGKYLRCHFKSQKYGLMLPRRLELLVFSGLSASGSVCEKTCQTPGANNESLQYPLASCENLGYKHIFLKRARISSQSGSAAMCQDCGSHTPDLPGARLGCWHRPLIP